MPERERLVILQGVSIYLLICLLFRAVKRHDIPIKFKSCALNIKETFQSLANTHLILAILNVHKEQL